MGKSPTKLIAFDKAHILTAMFSSYGEASRLLKVSRQAIAHCAQGHRIMCAGLYWRELSPELLIESDDLGKLTMESYDSDTNTNRKSYPPNTSGKSNTTNTNQ